MPQIYTSWFWASAMNLFIFSTCRRSAMGLGIRLECCQPAVIRFERNTCKFIASFPTNIFSYLNVTVISYVLDNYNRA